jgi:hypothetical protein
MDCNILADFRRTLYACFQRAGDALMNLVDALLTETPARSLAELSLSPCFERHWSSLYEALQDAKIDRTALHKLFADHVPTRPPGQRLVLGGDASSILRVASKTARDRTYVHAANLPEGTKPVRPGWQFSTLSILPEVNSSWTFVLKNDRIASTATQASVMKDQLEQALPLLPAGSLRPIWLGDGYYGSYLFIDSVADLPCDVLARFAKNRVLYREPPPAPAQPGRGHPIWHGTRFACHDPATQGTPDQTGEQRDAHDHKIEVACWHGLHFKKARQVRVSVIRVTRQGATDTKRDPRVNTFAKPVKREISKK